MEYNKFQKASIKYFFDKPRGFIVAPAGSGKTLAILGLFNCLKQLKGLPGKLLVVTSLKGMKAYRKVEAEKIFSYMFDFIDSSNKNDKHYFQRDITVVSNSVFPDVKNMLFNHRKDFAMIAVDEIHNFRNGKTALVQAMRDFLKGYTKRVYGVSATPFYSRLEDAYHIFALLNLWLFGSWDDFFEKYVIYKKIPRNGFIDPDGKKYFCFENGYAGVALKQIYSRGYENDGNPVKNLLSHGWKMMPKMKDIRVREAYKDVADFHKVIKPFMFIKEDHDFEYNISIWDYKIDLHSLQGYDGLIDRIATEEDKNILPYLVRMQKLFSQSEEKMRLLLEQVEALDAGVLIYFNYIETLEKVRDYFETMHLETVVFTGTTKDLEKKVEGLKGTEIVLMSPVGTQSLDFYFQNAIVYEMFYVPGQFEQFIGRMTRFNAKYIKVNLTFLISFDTIEEYFYLRFWELLQATSSNGLKKILPLTRPDVEKFKDKNGQMSFALLKQILLWREKE
jgi:superfamily II DNA or RNA helicase